MEKNMADENYGSLRAIEKKLKKQRDVLTKVRTDMAELMVTLFGGEEIDTGICAEVDKRCFTDTVHMLINQADADIDEIALMVSKLRRELNSAPEVAKAAISPD